MRAIRMRNSLWAVFMTIAFIFISTFGVESTSVKVEAADGIPGYSGNPSVQLNNNIPGFTADELTTTVYITKTGDCYHSDGCSSLRKSKIETTLKNATDRGYRACSKCNPGILDASAPAGAADTTLEANAAKSSTNNKSGNGFDTYSIPEQQNTDETYVLNTKSLKIHHPTCNDVKKIKPDNYATSSESRDTLISKGYSLCGHCFK